MLTCLIPAFGVTGSLDETRKDVRPTERKAAFRRGKGIDPRPGGRRV